VLVKGTRGASWAVFDCPCVRRHRLLIALDPRTHPRWRISGRRRPSLTPSIDVVETGMRCHFWLTKGAVKWSRDSVARSGLRNG